MAKTKTKGLGTLVKIDSDGTGVFTTIDCVMTIGPMGREREEIDGTCLEDTLEAMAAGIEKAGEFTFKEIWSITDHASDLVDTAFGSGTPYWWEILFPTSSPIAQKFKGFVTKIGPETVEKGAYVTRTVTVRRTGAITYGATSS
jgi:hypothetical protein